LEVNVCNGSFYQPLKELSSYRLVFQKLHTLRGDNQTFVSRIQSIYLFLLPSFHSFIQQIFFCPASTSKLLSFSIPTQYKRFVLTTMWYYLLVTKFGSYA